MNARPRFLGPTNLAVDRDGAEFRPESTWDPRSKYEYAIVFDISKPLTPQFERAEEMLSRRQKDLKLPGKMNAAAKKAGPEALRRCLRLLDARAMAGGSASGRAEIAAVLYRGFKNPTEIMAEDLKTAKAFRDGGYRAYLLLTNPRERKAGK